MQTYVPEGLKTGRETLKYSLEDMRKALSDGSILEFKALRSDTELNLYTYIGKGITGIIPYNEIELTFDGSQPKSIAVIAKVGETVAAKVTSISDADTNGEIYVTLSRKEAQKECKENYLDTLKPGDIIDAIVRNVEKYGLFCDIGCGIPALLPIDNFCVSRMQDPKEDLRGVSSIRAVVKSRDGAGRLLLSHKELLGTWAEEAAKFTAGSTVVGTVRSVQDYGIFVELTPNLSGLADCMEGINPGDQVSVYIKSIIPERMKVKLLIVSKKEPQKKLMERKFDYLIKGSHIDYWKYSPDNCTKLVETTFGE